LAASVNGNPPSASPKARLADSADDLYRAIRALGAIPSPQGLLHPVVRVLGMPDLRVTASGVDVLVSDALGVRAASAAEIDALHDALEQDQVRVLAMSPVRSDPPSHPVFALHEGAGNGFMTPNTPARMAQPAPAATPAQESDQTAPAAKRPRP
jgi:hypothetical protein